MVTKKELLDLGFIRQKVGNQGHNYNFTLQVGPYYFITNTIKAGSKEELKIELWSDVEDVYYSIETVKSVIYCYSEVERLQKEADKLLTKIDETIEHNTVKEGAEG
jgi:hypothetical protein